jgi:hypothetical protein
MGNGGKLATIALFVITTREKKKMMTTSPSSFSLQVEGSKNWMMATSLLSLPCSQQKTKEKKGDNTLCAITLFTSNINK